MGNSKKDITEGILYTITNYVFWFFLSSLYFFLVNIPLVFILILILTNGSKPLPSGFFSIAFLCFIPIGPGLTALFSVMGKLIRQKDINVTKDFYKAYKENFLQSIFIWVIEMILIATLIIDINFFVYKGYPRTFIFIFYILIIYIFSLSFYIFPIISRFYLKSKDILKTAIIYSIKRFHITCLNLATFLAIGYILLGKFTQLLFFFFSILCFLIMFYQQKMLKEIEEGLEKNK